jgi:general secretion pathway protein G
MSQSGPNYYANPGYYQPPNPLATWALVLGIIALVLAPAVIGGVLGIAALIMGIAAARRPTGKGLAIAGIALGAFAIVGAALAGWIIFSIYRLTSPLIVTPHDETVNQVFSLKVALDQFEIDTDRLPTTAEGLEALKTSPPDVATKWHGPYLQEIPLDSWARPFIYVSPGKTEAYDITSTGPDGILGTPDDITQNTPRP